MTTMDVLGARLYYELHGSGPLLVMIPGAGGTADVFRAVAGHLAALYTVLVYDRRGFSRSRLDGEQDYERRLDTDADDVRRLVEHVAGEPATIVGASSGAIVALATLARHPAVVDRLVPFEPPVMRLLPDGQGWLDFFADVYGQYREHGIEPALTGFRERTFPVSDLRMMAHAPRNEANAAYWFEHELRQYPRVDLDLDTLAAHADRIVPAVGRDGAGYPCHDATLELGRRLGCPVVELPGGHVGFVAHPEEFARDLTRALRPGHRRGTRSASDWDDVYADTPRWDIGRAQPAFRALADAGRVQGRVLDVGCGTGEHVLMAAELGLDATGLDIAPTALRAAQRKAHDRGLTARYLRHDVRKLADLGEHFDTVLDCGLFHIFDDTDRAAYVTGVRSVLRSGGRFFMLCFSDRTGDPLGVSRQEITTTFTDGWRVDGIEPATVDSRTDPDGVPAWLVALTRT